MFGRAFRASACPGHEIPAAQQTSEPVIVEAHTQARSDQPYRNLRWWCASSSANWRSWCWSCGFASFGFLLLAQFVHIEVAVGFEPVFVGFDGECADKAQPAGGVGEYPHDIGSPTAFLLYAFEHVGACRVLVMPACQQGKGDGVLDRPIG